MEKFEELETSAKKSLESVKPILLNNQEIIKQFDNIKEIIAKVEKTTGSINFDEIGKKVYEKFKSDFKVTHPNYNDYYHEQDRQTLENALFVIRKLKDYKHTQPTRTLLSRLTTKPTIRPVIYDIDSLRLIALEKEIYRNAAIYVPLIDSDNPIIKDTYVGGKRRNTKRRKRTRKHR